MDKVKLNYSQGFTSGRSRDYYKGKSIHFAGKWAAGHHYVNDDFVMDLIEIDNTLLFCQKSHYSSEQNKPGSWKKDNSGNRIGINSEYWDFGITGSKGGIYIPEYDEETGHIVWKKSADDEGLSEIDLDLKEILADNIESLIEDTTRELIATKQNTAQVKFTEDGIVFKNGKVESTFPVDKFSEFLAEVKAALKESSVPMEDPSGNLGVIVSADNNALYGVAYDAGTHHLVSHMVTVANGAFQDTTYDVVKSVSNKVQKITKDDGIYRAYTANGNGGQSSMRVTTVADAGYMTIMSRTADGRTSVADPSLDKDAANKKYVDDAVTDAIEQSKAYTDAHSGGGTGTGDYAFITVSSTEYEDVTDVVLNGIEED